MFVAHNVTTLRVIFISEIRTGKYAVHPTFQ